MPPSAVALGAPGAKAAPCTEGFPALLLSALHRRTAGLPTYKPNTQASFTGPLRGKINSGVMSEWKSFFFSGTRKKKNTTKSKPTNQYTPRLQLLRHVNNQKGSELSNLVS